jgi:hypothetical protein
VERRQYSRRTTRGSDRRQRRTVIEFKFHLVEAGGRPICHRWVDVELRPGLTWTEVGADERCEACALCVIA